MDLWLNFLVLGHGDDKVCKKFIVYQSVLWSCEHFVFLSLLSLLNTKIFCVEWLFCAIWCRLVSCIFGMLQTQRFFGCGMSPIWGMMRYMVLFPLFLELLSMNQSWIICIYLTQEFSPGSNGRNTTMGVYVRDLILGQVCFLTSAFRMEISTLFLQSISVPTFSFAS